MGGKRVNINFPISPYKHFTDFCLLLCSTSFCNCPIIGLMKNFSLASLTIDLLSSRYLLQEAAPENSWVLTWSYLHIYINSHFIEEIYKYFFVLKFMQLITPTPAYYFTISFQLAISFKLISTLILTPSMTIPSFNNWSHSVYDNHVMFLILVVSNQIYVFT